MTGLCIAASGIAVYVGVAQFTLSWTHTVEKTLWEEVWLAEPGQLVLVRARVQGSGAGMEPPPEARKEGDGYVWEPGTRRKEIVLRRYSGVADWRLCAEERCAGLGEWLAADADPVTIRPAEGGASVCQPAE